MSAAENVAKAIQGGYITGIQDGPIVPRLEIDEFALDRDMLNLFLLALESLQAKDPRDPWSWFQIAGIHGEPSAPWDHVDTRKPDQGLSTYAGYCAHSSITFPTWHRPYVAMMEQAVYHEMTLIAVQYTTEADRQLYTQACSRFRFPYWDPFAPRELKATSLGQPLTFGVPLLVSSPEIYLRRPSAPAHLRRTRNPLYSYNFPDARTLASLQGDNTSFWAALPNTDRRTDLQRTVRAPDAMGISNDEYINMQLSGPARQQVGASLYDVLTSPNDWNAFSNDAMDRSKLHQSVEGFHDNIHGIVGQGHQTSASARGAAGHMSYPAYASFDPIFWLHHCNVDRIIALWQASRGDASKGWWTRLPAGEANRTTDTDVLLTPEAPLLPFRRGPRSPPDDLTNLYTSEGVRDWRVFGYTYLVKQVVFDPAKNSNKMVTSPLQYGPQPLSGLQTYFNQFYQWLAAPGTAIPDLIHQFYPIEVTNIEALSGVASERLPPHGLVPLPPDATQHQPTQHPISQPSQPHAQPAVPPVVISTPPLANPFDDHHHSNDIPNTHPPHPVIVTLPSYPFRLSGHSPPSTTHVSPSTIDYRPYFDSRCIDGDNRLRQWDLHIVAQKFALLDGQRSNTYSVIVFLGPFNPNIQPIEDQPSYIGTDTVFANTTATSAGPPRGHCGNCATQAKDALHVLEVMPLTHFLIHWVRSRQRCPPEANDGIYLEDLSYEQVSAFLAKNLHWRVVDSGGRIVPNGPEFVNVTAVDRVVRLPSRFDEAIVYEEVEYRGGSRREENGGDYGGGNQYTTEKGGSYGAVIDDRYPSYAKDRQDENAKGSGRKLCGLPCSVM